MHVRRSLRATAADLREHRDAARPAVVAQASQRVRYRVRQRATLAAALTILATFAPGLS